LAALSQAALIQRQTVDLGSDIETFCEWAFNNRGEQFYIQSLADMRFEPRWAPDLSSASQMQADFFGRIMIAAENYNQNISNGELRDTVLGAGSGSLRSLIEFPLPYLPGPLEGAESSPVELPDDLAKTVETQIKSEEVGPSSFVALVNSALIFRVGSNQADLAANTLKLGSHHLANIDDKSQLLSILNGLATVSAVSRGKELADQLRVLVRKYRRDPIFALTIDEAIGICLRASASRVDQLEWCSFLGEWLTELAFETFQGDEGEVLFSHLQCLFIAAPQLWTSCAKADAALRAYNRSVAKGVD